MRFEGTDTYIATPDLMLAVNAAVTLERPLLVKGEPGTGKTMLAEEVARSLERPLLQWHIKSTTKAQQGLYEYDAVSRLRDSQLGDSHVGDIAHYIKRGVLSTRSTRPTSSFPTICCVSSTAWSFTSTRRRRRCGRVIARWW